jgi:hypothetical protein
MQKIELSQVLQGGKASFRLLRRPYRQATVPQAARITLEPEEPLQVNPRLLTAGLEAIVYILSELDKLPQSRRQPKCLLLRGRLHAAECEAPSILSRLQIQWSLTLYIINMIRMARAFDHGGSFAMALYSCHCVRKTSDAVMIEA